MSGRSYEALFVIDPLEELHAEVDSSVVMISEATRRGHRPSFVTLEGLFAQGPDAFAHATRIEIDDPQADPVSLRSAETRVRPLKDFDVVVMRKDPPVDENFITATWCLELAKKDSWVINDPQGLRDLNEKLAILPFPELTPATRVLRRISDLHQALDDFGGKMIVKPVYGFGGREILHARRGDTNLSTLFEMATQDETRWTIAQAYIESASEGDKRILLVDGEPIGAVLRVPAQGELRSNFHAGGSPARAPLDARDLTICGTVGPYLRERGQFFVGLDVIGGLLTEINVTSPTGMQEINRLDDLHGDATMQARFWTSIEAKLGR